MTNMILTRTASVAAAQAAASLTVMMTAEAGPGPGEEVAGEAGVAGVEAVAVKGVVA
jgi:hypothetical protein